MTERLPRFLVFAVMVVLLMPRTWLTVASAQSVDQPVDFYTLGCLVGYENDPNPESCTVLFPELRAQVYDAHKQWLKRNASALQELQSACRERLSRAYDNDESQVEIAKQRAQAYQEKQMKLWRAHPDQNRINCRAYIEDFSTGNEKVDIQKRDIDEIKNGKAKPIDWSNAIFKMDTQ
jgi:hypothetical protein